MSSLSRAWVNWWTWEPNYKSPWDCWTQDSRIRLLGISWSFPSLVGREWQMTRSSVSPAFIEHLLFQPLCHAPGTRGWVWHSHCLHGAHSGLGRKVWLQIIVTWRTLSCTINSEFGGTQTFISFKVPWVISKCSWGRETLGKGEETNL